MQYDGISEVQEKKKKPIKNALYGKAVLQK